MSPSSSDAPLTAEQAQERKSLLAKIHHRYAYEPRIAALVALFTEHLRPGDRVLDIGCGSGILGGRLLEAMPELTVEGVESHPRGNEPIRVHSFDGKQLPFEDDGYDVVILADVLHHDHDPVALMTECARVAKRSVIVKDHLKHGWFSNLRICFLDWIANTPHGVPVLYTYWTMEEWKGMFAAAGLEIESMVDRMSLYHWSLDLVFGGRLHLTAFTRPV